MTESTDTDIERVIVALKKVPEKHLLLIDLASSLSMKDGELDYEEVKSRQPEVEMAIAEAKMYGSETLQAVQNLEIMGGGGDSEDDEADLQVMAAENDADPAFLEDAHV